MGKVVWSAVTLVFLAASASAQIPSANVFFGYSYFNTNLGSTDRSGTNGWELAAEGKVLPLLGTVADFDAHYGSQNFPVTCPVVPGSCSAHADFTEHNYLFGPRISVSLAKFRPFGQVLIGGAHAHVNHIDSSTSFATAVGGGLDYKLLPLLAWRFQLDYVHTHLFSAKQNNARFSTGIVLRF